MSVDQNPNATTLDRIGVVASSLCAVHCALTPFAIGLLPLLGLSLLADERTEWAFVGVSVAVGFSSLLPAYFRRHRRARPLIFFTSGLSLIFIAHFLLEENLRLEIPAVLLGALLVITSHLLNLRLCRSCAACADDCRA